MVHIRLKANANSQHPNAKRGQVFILVVREFVHEVLVERFEPLCNFLCLLGQYLTSTKLDN